MDLNKLREAGEPLVNRGLDKFAHRADLNINYTVAGVEVSSKSHNDAVLALVQGLLDPVFSRAGWGFRLRPGYRRQTLVFVPPVDMSTVTNRRRGMR
jgi:hypothetical protein